MFLDVAKKGRRKQERMKEWKKKCGLQNETRNKRREEGNNLEIKMYP